MKQEYVHTAVPPRQPRQRWGPILRSIREAKGWTQAHLIRQYYKHVEKHITEEDDQEAYTLPEAWLRRAEEGVFVKHQRIQIELICKALECDVGQRWDVLAAAGYDFFADMHGNTSETDEVFKRAFTRLLSSKRARKVVQRRVNKRTITQSDDGPDWTLLFEALQELIEEDREQHPPALSAQPTHG